MTTYFWIKIQDIKDNTIIDDNVSDQTIKTTLIQVQDTMLQRLIGTKLFNEIQTDIKNGTLSGDNKTLLTEFIHPYLINATVWKIGENLTFKYSAQGVNKNEDDDTEYISQKQLDALKKEHERIVNFYADTLQRYLLWNSDKYPNYLETSFEGFDANNLYIENEIYFDDTSDFENDKDERYNAFHRRVK